MSSSASVRLVVLKLSLSYVMFKLNYWEEEIGIKKTSNNFEFSLIFNFESFFSQQSQCQLELRHNKSMIHAH